MTKLVRKGEARAKIERLGIDGVCTMVLDGITLTGIAHAISVHVASLLNWIEADPQRSAREGIEGQNGAAMGREGDTAHRERKRPVRVVQGRY